MKRDNKKLYVYEEKLVPPVREREAATAEDRQEMECHKRHSTGGCVGLGCVGCIFCKTNLGAYLLWEDEVEK